MLQRHTLYIIATLGIFVLVLGAAAAIVSRPDNGHKSGLLDRTENLQVEPAPTDESGAVGDQAAFTIKELKGTVPDDWSRFDDTDHGFSIAYPPNWRLEVIEPNQPQDRDPNELVLYGIKPPETFEEGRLAQVLVSLDQRPLDGVNMSLDQLREKKDQAYRVTVNDLSGYLAGSPVGLPYWTAWPNAENWALYLDLPQGSVSILAFTDSPESFAIATSILPL